MKSFNCGNLQCLNADDCFKRVQKTLNKFIKRPQEKQNVFMQKKNLFNFIISDVIFFTRNATLITKCENIPPQFR